MFKVTYDKDSTTVTDMGNSGFSFIETGPPSDPRMNKSMSHSKVDSRSSLRSIDNLLPFIHQYRRVMRSPASVDGRNAYDDEPISVCFN
jgi:hypothetical protein